MLLHVSLRKAKLLFTNDTSTTGQRVGDGMKHQATIALFRYWDRLRGDRPAPQRTEIEPADIKSLLADTFILEQDSRGEAIFRLAGTRLCATYGRELRGYSFPVLWSLNDQRIISAHASSVFHDNAIAAASFEGIGANDKTAAFEMVLLPLQGDQIQGSRSSARALGVIVPTTRPYWLGATPIEENHIISLRIAEPDSQRQLVSSRQIISGPSLMPDETEITSHGVENGRRIRHLVVIEGGRDD